MNSQSVHCSLPHLITKCAPANSFEPRDAEVLEDGSPSQDEKVASWRFLRQIEVNQTLTALYLIVEAGRWQHVKGEDESMREAVGQFKSIVYSRSQQLTSMVTASLDPCILTVLTRIMAKLRWEETSYIPLPRVVCPRANLVAKVLT